MNAALMNMSMKALFCLTTVLIVFFAAAVMAASVVGSKHDLSSSSYPPNEVCAYCHTPHFASSTIEAPLWNRRITNVDAFTMYASPTIDTSTSSKPSGISLACLSCHDGVSSQGRTSAVNSFDSHNLINAPGSGLGENRYRGNCARCHPSHATYSQTLQIGADLTNDHPISMAYPTAAQDAGFFIPADLQKGWPDVPLFRGKVECPSCHNVHDPARVPFLRIANSGSVLCYKCHNK